MLEIKSSAVRRTLGIILLFVLIPATVAAGALLVDAKYHAAVSLTVALLVNLFFVTGFERKKTGSRRLVIASVTVALSVAGRFIPFFKPVTALTVLTGMHLGGEAGYLVGAMSALISDLYFGMGPWTPFQMLAWGMIGLISGAAAPVLRRSRALTVAFGALSGVIFSLIMDVWTVLWYNEGFSASLYLAACITALPHTALYAVSNMIFLFLLAVPYGKKIERIKLKYDI